eukprot:CAMPEP_0178960340 /NCGR_PEP_ID=MMETSP0789-20121207/12908_1 /TAXON_ID=3005 /ORGANISM="Rhizosolenia setigera, Strain CCMP 1694" /LENGTH=404 /DNA_ID=CAMNT_0020643675 /DNA_START=471 /DNA_END=1685 /DNA_ORIENTATION=+
MPPEGELMIQNNYHREDGDRSPGSRSMGSPTRDQAQEQIQSSNKQMQQPGSKHSPSHNNHNPMYMQGGRPPYMNPPPPQMQHGPYNSHHPPHGYHMPPHYSHPGHPSYSNYSYQHQVQSSHNHPSYPPPHQYPMAHEPRRAPSSPSKANNNEKESYPAPVRDLPSSSTPSMTVKPQQKDNLYPSSPRSNNAIDDEALSTVDPMRPDFYWFVQDVRDDYMGDVKKHVQKCCPKTETPELEGELNDLVVENENHPYLLFSDLNERLIDRWESLAQSKRSEYLVKEEEDRKRFMNAEEVASQHCATLTARARSPQAFTPRNKNYDKKKKDDKNSSTSPGDRYTNRASPARVPSSYYPGMGGDKTNLQNMNKTRSLYEMNNGISNGYIGSQDVSPAKKNRIDPSLQTK